MRQANITRTCLKPLRKIACGVVAIVVLAASVQAEQSAASDREATSPPATDAHIVIETVRPVHRADSDRSRYGLRRDDLKAIVAQLSTVVRAVPVREIQRRATRADRTLDVALIGTTAEYTRFHELPIARGRFLTQPDNQQFRSVAVISEQVSRTLFPNSDPIGEPFRIGDEQVLVVGVSKGCVPIIYIPLETMRTRIGDRDLVHKAGSLSIQHFELSRIELLLESSQQVEASATVIDQILERRHEDSSYVVTTLFANSAQGARP